MDLQRVDLQHCAAQPWRNGGGLTRELLSWPAAARPHADWQLRVSVARIDRSGPFSPFPGVQRCFAVVHGEGVTLDLPGGRRTLGPQDEPVTFDGEDAPGCHLLEGPTEDLNLMALRNAGRPRLQRARPGSTLDGALRWRGLFAVSTALLDVEDQTEPVPAGTLVWTDSVDTPPWRLHSGAHAFWLSLES